MPNPLRNVDELGDAVRKTIRAYHGSPYDFDRFDSLHIDTGEGEQAFGYGLYFAGNENVAKHYRDMRPGELTLADEDELAGIMKRMRDLKSLARSIGKVDPRSADMVKEWAQLQSRRRFLEERPGHMYEVEIGYPEKALLAFDMPLDQQRQIMPFAEKAIGKIPDPRARHDAMGILEEADSNSGRDVYGILKAYAPPSDNIRGSAEFASRALMDSGVPGIRYLDAGSRRAGDGTRNYVIFPGAEDSIRILRKYGLLAPIAAGAMDDGQQ